MKKTLLWGISIVVGLIISLVFPVLAYSKQLVVGVSDGDTLTVLDESTRVQTKIRISAIDAPEKSQPFGQAAKKELSDLCYKKVASIAIINKDRYGRTVADVSCGGMDVARTMVSSGMAWVYDQYVSKHEYLYLLQDKARKQKKGLWSAEATSPWTFRKETRNK